MQIAGLCLFINQSTNSEKTIIPFKLGKVRKNRLAFIRNGLDLAGDSVPTDDPEDSEAPVPTGCPSCSWRETSSRIDLRADLRRTTGEGVLFRRSKMGSMGLDMVSSKISSEMGLNCSRRSSDLLKKGWSPCLGGDCIEVCNMKRAVASSRQLGLCLKSR